MKRLNRSDGSLEFAARARSTKRRVDSESASEGVRYATSPAMPNASRLLARIFKSRALMQEIIGEARAGFDEMLAVIENEQKLFVAQIIQRRDSPAD